MRARMLGWVAGSALAAAAAAFFLWQSTQAQPVRVALAAADEGRVEATVSNTRAGSVSACRRARLATPTSGRIQILAVREGERVRRGQLLLQLWNEDLVAREHAAREALTAAHSRSAEVCQLAENAVRETERARALRAWGFISEERFDRVESEARGRAAACDSARAQAKEAEARVRAAAAETARTVLRAPFDGIVAEVNGEVGEFLTPSPPGIPTLPAIDLIDDSCLYVSAPIDEVDAARLAVGMPARITLDSWRGKPFSGRLRRIAPYVLALEKQARTVEVEVEFDSPAEARHLLVGYSADVEIVLEARTQVLRIPTPALMPGNRVLVLGADGRLAEQRVQPGLSNWEYTEIRAGLAAGERVVTSLERPGVAPGARARRGAGARAVIALSGIERVFRGGGEGVHALRGVDLAIGGGEYVSIMGPSGSGKSTLLNIIGLLDRPDAGRYLLDGRDVTTLSDDERARLRRDKLGFVFQFFHLVPRLSVAQNVELPMMLAGIEPAQRRGRVARLLADYGLTERAQHRPSELSGGQCQRVAIARAAALRPAVILADEPTGNLDRHSGREVMAVLERAHAAGAVLIVVTHDPEIGARAPRRLRMVDGAIAGEG